MPITQLKAIGLFQPVDVASLQTGASSVDRPAMLMYAGEFETAEGPVTITPAHIDLLVLKHNALLSRIKRLGTTVPLKNCPPIQLDHSTSARDTVGRLVGDVFRGDHELDDGTTSPAVFGVLRILGAENVERVNDGRWTHVSPGVDLDEGRFRELTITPFPAAKNASLLKAPPVGVGDPVVKETKLSSETTEGDGMNKAQLKKYLMGVKGLSEADADTQLVKLEGDAAGIAALTAEESAHGAKLIADAAAAETVRLGAAREKITTLSASFKTNLVASQLAATQGRILTRLSRLRAEAKVTPAEIKKIDIAKLSAQGDDAINLVLKTYEDREPVIFVGQFGSQKAADVSKLADKKKAMAKLEAETRANMSLLRGKTDAKTTNLSEGAPGGGAQAEPIEEKVQPYAGTPGEGAPPEDMAYFEREYGEICRMMDGGQDPEAKERIKAFMQKALTAGGAGPAATDTNTMETEKQLSALAESNTKMQANFDELLTIATGLTGTAP